MKPNFEPGEIRHLHELEQLEAVQAHLAAKDEYIQKLREEFAFNEGRMAVMREVLLQETKWDRPEASEVLTQFAETAEKLNAGQTFGLIPKNQT